MFGDSTPHQFEDYVDIMSDPAYANIVTQQIDWRDEADELKKMVSTLTFHGESFARHFGSVMVGIRREGMICSIKECHKSGNAEYWWKHPHM